MKTKFNEYLTKLRKFRGYTQAQMAEKLGISRSTYTNYENGNRTPDFEVLGRISEVLACSLDELFGRKPTYVASCDVIKEDSMLYNVSGIQEEKPKLAIGVQDFRDLREKQAYYVDKTQFIEQFLESWYQITLITRPRRFGKTLTMDMVRTLICQCRQNFLTAQKIPPIYFVEQRLQDLSTTRSSIDILLYFCLSLT